MMEIWKELLGTFVGQLSLAVIIVVLLMGAFYVRLFIKKMKEGEAEQRRLNKHQNHASSTR